MSNPKPPAGQQTARALEARRARTQASLQRVQEVVDHMVKARTPVTIAAVSRHAEVSRTFLYEHEEAQKTIREAIARAAGRQRQDRHDEAQAIEAFWRERALNCEDALKAAQSEILRQREHIAELLGQVRDLQTGWTEEDRVRMTTESLTLKRRVRDLETEHRNLADRLAAARENNRFADRRIADLEARIADPATAEQRRLAALSPPSDHTP